MWALGPSGFPSGPSGKLSVWTHQGASWGDPGVIVSELDLDSFGFSARKLLFVACCLSPASCCLCPIGLCPKIVSDLVLTIVLDPVLESFRTGSQIVSYLGLEIVSILNQIIVSDPVIG